MIQALKLGFRYSSLQRVSPANCSSVDFGRPLVVNMEAVCKRLRSRSTALAGKNVEKASSFDMGESQKNASKASRKNCSLIDESEGEKEKSAAVKTNSKRKVKGLSDSDYVVRDNGSGISGSKRTKPQANRTSEDSVRINPLQATAQAELTIESAEIKGEKSVETRSKISSRVATSGIKTHVNVEHSVDEPWTVLTHKKPQDGWTAYNPKTMRPQLSTDTPHMKLISWNVNGLRAAMKLGDFSNFAQREDFDVLCLQETKLQEKNVDAIRKSFLEAYEHSYWTCSAAKLGYSGTSIISRIKPQCVKYGLGISDHDTEGRLVTVEFDHFYLLCGYVPNSGDGLKRLSYRITQWDPSLSNYMKDLERSKPVILSGDLNCAHQEMDIWNPAGNRRSAGFTDEERQSFQTNFLDKGFVDTFRKQHPDKVGYTYWGYRHGGRKTNRGWRLDYFLASESIAHRVHDSYILPDVGGSDHSPIGLILRL